jgi:virginiamycin B lyase
VLAKAIARVSGSCLLGLLYGALGTVFAQTVSVAGFPVPNGAVAIAAGPDGALWFTESTSNQIGRITTTGILTEYPVPTTGAALRGIASGPDGALWFTESLGSATLCKIGRITTSGTITEYAVPVSPAIPVPATIEDITAGPDGAMWFTILSIGSVVGRITMEGTVTQYQFNGPNSGGVLVLQR